MPVRPIVSMLSMERVDHRLGGARRAIAASNVGFRTELSNFTYWSWCQCSFGYQRIIPFPYRMSAFMLSCASKAQGAPLRHMVDCPTTGYYPYNGTNYLQNMMPYNWTQDSIRMRRYNTTPAYSTSGECEFALGSLTLAHDRNNYSNSNPGSGNIISALNVPGTIINAPYMHPALANSWSVTTAVGQPYVTGLVNLGNMHQYLTSIIRIESGADRGVYFGQSLDQLNGRLYLMNMDGTKFVAKASATVTASAGINPAWFNQTGVIQSSTGQVFFDGRYDPGQERDSKIFRIHFEKSGSPSPAAEAQRGSYWLSVRNWTHGNGVWGGSWQDAGWGPGVFNHVHGNNFSRGFYYGLSYVTAGMSYCGWRLDPVTQQLWTVFTNGSYGSLAYWNYKSIEGLNEVASSSAAVNNLNFPLTPALTFQAPPRAIEMGSDRSIYVMTSQSADHTKEGWYRIKTDGTWTFVSSASVGLTGTGNYASAMAIDKSRARTGTAGDASTTAAGHLISASGAFTAADRGRCVTITGASADTGTYLISAINSTTDVTLTLVNGSAVSFTGGSGGTYQIGDRLYLMVTNDTTWMAGFVKYLDSMYFGVIFATTATRTNGATAPGINGFGDGTPACVDPQTGRFFWYSTDVVKYINMFDPSTQTVTQRPFSDLAVQVSGSNANPTAPSTINCMAVNPNSYFRELWIGTDQGHYRFNVDNFTAQFARFWGNNDGTYAESDGNRQLSGSPRSDYTNLPLNDVREYGFLKDGQVFCRLVKTPYIGSYSHAGHFNRETHCWQSAYGAGSNQSNLYPTDQAGTYTAGNAVFWDPDGTAWVGTFYDLTGNYNNNYKCPSGYLLPLSAIHYQWIGGQWVAKEVVRGALPDNTSSPGCMTKPLHTSSDDLVYGVKVRFVSSGATNGENNEFLGRSCQRGLQRTDGATSAGGATLTGSGFSSLSFSSDTGRYYVRLESGNNQGTYIITGVTGDTTVTLLNMNGTTPSFSAGSTLTYTVWDAHYSPIGPECCTVLAACGFSRDNTQDINNIYMDWYAGKTLLSEQAESIKFCSDLIPPPGSAGFSFYGDAWNKTGANYAPSQGAHLGLGSVSSGVATAFDGQMERQNTGVSLPTFGTNGVTNFYVQPADSASAGFFMTADFGADVEVGKIIIRTSRQASYASSPPTWTSDGGNPMGLLGNWYKANDAGGVPVASSVVRCSGTANLTVAYRAASATLGSGDFLGSSSGTSGVDGSVAPAVAASTFTVTAGTFSQTHVGMILKITSGVDAGNYRILTASIDGSQVTIRNLDQTTKVFSVAASGLSYTVYDGVREEDRICAPSIAAPTDQMTVEYLSNDAKTVYFRTPVHAALTNSNWQCAKPTWDLVKRISCCITTPPEVVNNGTWVAYYGKDRLSQHELKIVADLSDLASAKRTGRYWRFSMQNRGWYTNGYDDGGGYTYIDALEFYSPSGARIGFCKYNRLDTVSSEANFFTSYIHRIDFIQASDTAVGGSFNGVAALGGTAGDTVTLSGGKKFIGFQVRPAGANGSAAGGSNTFTNSGSDPGFVSSDAGRLLRIISGVNAGYYRVLTVTSATAVTLTTPSGNAVTLTADAGPTPYTVHEGINVGTTGMDFFVFTTAGVASLPDEYTIYSISDDLSTIVLNEKLYKSLSSQNWEIRRRASLPGSGNSTVSGQISTDPKGFTKCWPADIGGTVITGSVGSAGATLTAPSGTFTIDDVGRVVVITSGTNKGSYYVAGFTSSTTVTLNSVATEAAATLVVDASVMFRIQGERRFRISRYVTVLRQ